MTSSTESRDRPLLAVTMGDPAGIGPETILGAWADPQIHAACRLLAVGRPAIFRRAAKLLDSPVEVHVTSSTHGCESSPTRMFCLECGHQESESIVPAAVDPRGGQAAYDALCCATQLVLAGQANAVVTAPLNKAALWAAGHHYPGHTELLAELCGVRDFAMMLYLAPGPGIQGRAGLGVVHVTLHTALRSVFDQLSVEQIVSKAGLANRAVERFLRVRGRPGQPRIGIAALNPHAGEDGLFGDEEQRIIAPAVQACRAAGWVVEGPLPCDTLMVRAAAGDFDSVVAMYHDQGHIALKLIGMHRAVNVTLGLPIIRTSVAHGTAFDLAWQGRATTTGMTEALLTAAQLAGPGANR